MPQANDPVDPLFAAPAHAGPPIVELVGTAKSPPPWGPWATIAWGLLIVAVMVATQLIAVFAGAIIQGVVKTIRAGGKLRPQGIDIDSTVTLYATLAAMPVVLGLIALVVKGRGWSIRRYLSLRLPRFGESCVAVVGLIALIAATDLLTRWLGRPVVSDAMTELLDAPRWLILAALLVSAPLWEEALFRGFLYRGLADAPSVGPGLAIGLTSLAFASLHIQYDLFDISVVYLIGLYLGYVRYKTGSTTLTIGLHFLANAIASAEAFKVIR